MDENQSDVPTRGFPGRWLKAMIGENVEVGAAYLAGQAFGQELNGYLLDFRIAEQYRRRGAGKRLMEAVKAAAKREGCKRIAVMMPYDERLKGWLVYVGFSELGSSLVLEL